MDFDIQAFISDIKPSTHTVEVYADTSQAMRIVELSELAKAEQQIPGVRAITDLTPQQEAEAEIETIRQNALVITMRALSAKEIEVLRKRIIHEMPMAKGLSEEARAQAEEDRTQTMYERFIAVATTEVEDRSRGTKSKTLRVEDVETLHKMLPSAMWRHLVEGFNIAQGAGDVMLETLSDATFRRYETIAETERASSIAAEDSEGSEPSSDTVSEDGGAVLSD